jgi:hypothetical protein
LNPDLVCARQAADVREKVVADPAAALSDTDYLDVHGY